MNEGSWMVFFSKLVYSLIVASRSRKFNPLVYTAAFSGASGSYILAKGSEIEELFGTVHRGRVVEADILEGDAVPR